MDIRYNWVPLNPATNPTGPGAGGAAYDANNSKVVQFGGIESNGKTSKKTWTYNIGGVSHDWTNEGPTHTPLSVGSFPNLGVKHCGMAYLPSAGKVILYGGESGDSGGAGDPTNYFPADTWGWDGSDWSKYTTTHKPSNGRLNGGDPYGFSAVSLSYSATLGKVIFEAQAYPFFTTGALTSHKMGFNGTDWSNVTITSDWPATDKYCFSTAVNPNTALIIGQGTDDSGSPVSQTWKYDTNNVLLTSPDAIPASSSSTNNMAWHENMQKFVLTTPIFTPSYTGTLATYVSTNGVLWTRIGTILDTTNVSSINEWPLCDTGDPADGPNGGNVVMITSSNTYCLKAVTSLQSVLI